MYERGGIKKRRRVGFLLALFIAAAIFFAIILTGGLFFKIKEVRVEGAVVSSMSEIAERSGFDMGDYMFLINKPAASRSIISALPYIKTVRVKREWPSTVVIIVGEAAPAAIIECNGLYWLFDGYGSLLETVPVLASSELPIVKGLAIQDPILGTKLYPSVSDEVKITPLLSLLKIMQDEGVWEDTGTIDLSSLSNIVFTYRDIYTVELGMPEALEIKIKTLVLALEDEKVASRGAGTFYLAPAAEGKQVRFNPDNS
jgi:hypothetical protein